MSLRHMINILLDRSLKIFQIAAICREMMSDLLYMHEELNLTHDALNCDTILLNINKRMKINKYYKEIVNDF